MDQAGFQLTEIHLSVTMSSQSSSLLKFYLIHLPYPNCVVLGTIHLCSATWLQGFEQAIKHKVFRAQYHFVIL